MAVCGGVLLREDREVSVNGVFCKYTGEGTEEGMYFAICARN